MSRRWLGSFVIALALLAWSAAARAHPGVATVAIVKVTADRQVQVTLIHDALAFALNDVSVRVSDEDMLALMYGPEADLAAAFTDGRERLESGFKLLVDGKMVPFTIVQAPDLEAARKWRAENPTRRLPCKLEFVISAELPALSAGMTLRFPGVLADVMLSVDRAGVEPLNLPLGAGELSPMIDIGMATGASPGAQGEHQGIISVAWRYTKLGYRHIVPKGADHALFVLGLFLLTPRPRALLLQITAFTLAHSVTLTLASLHLVTIRSSIVEPVIAFTIAFVAIENLFAKRVSVWRPVVAFCFGLVHGLGFASGLMEIGLPTGQLVTGLVAFSVGIEAGHVTMLAGAFLVLGWWRDKPWYRKRVAIPISVVIAGVALFWMVMRI